MKSLGQILYEKLHYQDTDRPLCGLRWEDCFSRDRYEAAATALVLVAVERLRATDQALAAIDAAPDAFTEKEAAELEAIRETTPVTQRGSVLPRQ